MTSSTGTQAARKALFAQGLKTCCDCGATKPLPEFTRIARSCSEGVSSFTAACKPCRNARNEKYRTSDPVRVKALARANHLQREYGLTPEQFNVLFESQKGCCAICLAHQSELGESLRVDHDHETNEVRGLLCRGCNTGLGFFEDSPATLTAAVEYLCRHGEES